MECSRNFASRRNSRTSQQLHNRASCHDSHRFSLENDFPPVGYDTWRALAEADLHGATFEQKLVTHTYEGIDIQPLYTRRDRLSEGDDIGFPGLPPFVRGSQSLGTGDGRLGPAARARPSRSGCHEPGDPR